LAPGLRGLGYGMITIPAVMNFYYTLIMAYSVYYLFMGFAPDKQLPWSRCSHDFNTINCYSLLDAENCTDTQLWYDKKCTEMAEFCTEFGYDDFENNTHCLNPRGDFPGFNETIALPTVLVPVQNISFRVSSAEEFWYKDVLELNVTFLPNGTQVNLEENSWTNWGKPNYKIAGCLALCWTLVAGFLIKGAQSYGKVVYFTTLFPYVVLTTLLVYVATLPGFSKGVEYYITPDWSKLGDFNIWNEAAGQIFYSLNVAVGSQLLLASYNNFNNNCQRDALVIGLCNSLTSLYAGLVVFGVIGFIAEKKQMDVESVVDEGPGLAFIVYPEAVSAMAISPFFSFMFFFMLCLLAISSICGDWEACIASVLDEFPKLRKKRGIVTIAACFFAFLMGLPMCFESGFFLFQLMDQRTANSILLMAFIELIIIAWFYGVDGFFKNVEEMKIRIPGFMKIYWKTCWLFITPVLIGLVTVSAWIDHTDDHYLNYDPYPPFAQFLGWGIELFSVSIVFFYGAYYVFKKWRAGEDVAFLRPGPMLSPKGFGPRADSGLPISGQANDGYTENA
jgi:solute carrier family 6 amino acid transporter-like protein 5/7/9/14